MAKTRELLIPRKLAQQLFHLAQAPQDQAVAGCIIQHADGRLEPVVANAELPAGTQLFGHFQRLAPGQQQPAAFPGTGWLLTLSLDIKGVLQLHAWCNPSKPQEVPVRILATD